MFWAAGVSLVVALLAGLTGCGTPRPTFVSASPMSPAPGTGSPVPAAPAATGSRIPGPAVTSYRPPVPQPLPASLTVKREPCKAVPADLVTRILGRFEPSWVKKPTYRPIDAAGWRTQHGPIAWYIAVKFHTDDGEQPGDHIGIWASNSLEPNEGILAVDGTAVSFTGWPSADMSDPTILTDYPGDRVKYCMTYG